MYNHMAILMKKHTIEIFSSEFQPIVDGKQTFIARRKEKIFDPGDFLEVYEIMLDTYGDRTGRKALLEILYIVQDEQSIGIRQGYQILCIELT